MRALILKLAAACAGIILALTVSEVVLRIIGDQPGPAPVAKRIFAIDEKFPFQPPFGYNPNVGWQLQPGSYDLPVTGSTLKIKLNVNDDFSRVTQPSSSRDTSVNKKHTLLFVGDSYVFGEGLNDNETLPWQAQSLLPDWRVVNHAVGGYGTCQAIWRFTEVAVPLRTMRDGLVVYGLSEFHESRNVADPRQDYWVAMRSPGHTSLYPRCSINNGQIEVQRPQIWPVLVPFTGQLVLSQYLTNAILAVLARPIVAEQQAVTEKLLSEFDRKVRAFDAKFVVLLQDIHGEKLAHYQQFLQQAGIAFIDGSEATKIAAQRLPDGHPGPLVTRHWARQISAYIHR